MSTAFIPCWVVTQVQPNADYTLILSFADGSRKLYDCKHLLTKPIFKKLNNIGFFLKAHCDGTSVVWDDTIDISPEELYYNSTFIA